MKKILIVDDSADILEVLTLLFDLEGYEVKTIDNGYVINEAIAEFKPDLILLDVMLGLLDGRMICSELKSSPLTSNIPVIMISASHDLNALSQKSCHADDFVAKPFEIDALLAKVCLQLAS
jgi:DNA-binding response OmpR family regulator